MTKEECRARARADYEAVKGKLIRVEYLMGYLTNGQDSQEQDFEKSIVVRVEETTPGDIDHWVDEWLDPYWNVTIVQTDHPELPKGGLVGCWVFGHSYNTKNDDSDRTFLELVTPNQETT
jgi:hypothetical protein